MGKLINPNVTKVLPKAVAKALNNPGAKLAVKSSNIKKVAYDNKLRDLTIVFINGNREYVYHNVPYGVYANLVNAQSKGEYFHSHIRFKYKYEEVK